MIQMSCACTLPAVVLRAFRGGVRLVLAFTGDEASSKMPRGSGEESLCRLIKGIWLVLFPCGIVLAHEAIADAGPATGPTEARGVNKAPPAPIASAYRVCPRDRLSLSSMLCEHSTALKYLIVSVAGRIETKYLIAVASALNVWEHISITQATSDKLHQLYCRRCRQPFHDGYAPSTLQFLRSS